MRQSWKDAFESSPTVRLLRSDNALYVADFLRKTFKDDGKITVGQEDLRIILADYLDELHELDAALLQDSPERYLSKWTEAGWLTRFLEATSEEPVFQLTPHTEEAIRFLDSIANRTSGLIGTESRLKLVIHTLEDCVRGASPDPELRLAHLRAQRDAIDKEVSRIESNEPIEVYHEGQIREQFQTAAELLKALQSDFRAVESRFHQIARDAQKRQIGQGKSRGEIIAEALDAEDLLKQQDEGQSFYSFVRFLISPKQQAKLRETIAQLKQISALESKHEDLERIQKMVPLLLAEADKVMKTIGRLSTTLKRLLDSKATAHRLRLGSVLQDIKASALQLRDQHPRRNASPHVSDHCTLAPFTTAALTSPMSRRFWHPAVNFEDDVPEPHVVDLESVQRSAERISSLQRLDLRVLRNHIRESTLSGEHVELKDLIENYESNGGVVELLGYLQIAHDDSHQIDTEDLQTISIEDNSYPGRKLRVRLPKVVFLPRSVAKLNSRRPK